MTLIISSDGVKNTESTRIRFGAGGSVGIGGDFQNTGSVEVDTRANLNILGNVINAGTFHVKDYVSLGIIDLMKKAANDLNGDAKRYIDESIAGLENQDNSKADSTFKKFWTYIGDHPELVTASVQILLQLFAR